MRRPTAVYLTQGLHRALQRHPDRIALTHASEHAVRQHSFAAVANACGRQAALLAARGIEAGDRVALLAPNHDELILALLACWWRGAVPCPLNLRWSPVELAQAMAGCQPSLLLADPSLAAQVPASATPCDTLEHFAAEACALPPLPDSRTGGDALAAILYTGGTTGRAKGVMLSHANFWAAALARGAELNNTADSVSLLVAPLFHVASLCRLIGQLIMGGSCVTLTQFRPATVLAAIEAHRITDTIMVPTMLQALLDAPGFDPARVASLDRIAFGAAPMPPDLLDRALAAWPRAEFFQAYGLTETAGAVCINPPANHRSPEARARGRLHAVGRAGLGAEIQVVDAALREVPRGTVGEVLVRGPMITAGYWQDPEATAAAFHDGWFRTGDAGRMDAEGYLEIVDRLKDMIISGGENVYCAEVEAALRSHPAVLQAAVVGVPHPHWGETVHAVVVLEEAGCEPRETAAATVEALQSWCRDRLAGYKCPRSIAFAPSLPLSASGKVLKHQLRAQASG